MKRFDFEEDDDDDDDEYYESEEENFGMYPMDIEDHLLSMTHFPMDGGDSLLPSAIQICEKSLFWRFRTIKYKVKKIRMVYLALKDFIEEEEKE